MVCVCVCVCVCDDHVSAPYHLQLRNDVGRRFHGRRGVFIYRQKEWIESLVKRLVCVRWMPIDSIVSDVRYGYGPVWTPCLSVSDCRLLGWGRVECLVLWCYFDVNTAYLVQLCSELNAT